jgi:hypothetical protein
MSRAAAGRATLGPSTKPSAEPFQLWTLDGSENIRFRRGVNSAGAGHATFAACD